MVVNHMLPVHFEVLVLCEKLRVARGIAPRSNLDRRLFLLKSRNVQAQATLKKNLSINYHELTSLVRILRRLEQETGLTILTDWPALLASGWNPATEATLTVENETAAATLTKLLTPYGLTFKVVDAETLQVTTQQAALTENEIELYSAARLIEKGGSPLAVLSLLRTAIGPAQFRAGGGLGVLRYDGGSNTIIASAPQPLQLQIESLLEEWRKAAE